MSSKLTTPSSIYYHYFQSLCFSITPDYIVIMIYAHGLGLAVVGCAIIQSESKNVVINQEAKPFLHPHADAERNLGYVNSDNTENTNIPFETCMTEAACDEQRRRLGFIHYYVSD